MLNLITLIKSIIQSNPGILICCLPHLVSLVVCIYWLRKAPQAVEDERGFVVTEDEHGKS